MMIAEKPIIISLVSRSNIVWPAVVGKDSYIKFSVQAALKRLPEKGCPKAAFRIFAILIYLATVQAIQGQRPVPTTATGHEANAGKALDHHRQSGGFGDGASETIDPNAVSSPVSVMTNSSMGPATSRH
jgi:hypothetical protein